MNAFDKETDMQCEECGDVTKEAVALDVDGLGEIEGLYCTQQCARVSLERKVSFTYYTRKGIEYETLKERLVQ